jgi:predicted TPR repeat methyltransferase
MQNRLDFNVSQLTEQHKKEMEKHANFSQDSITDHYNELAVNYEQIYLRVGWPDPKRCAEYCRDLVNVANSTKETARVLDLGCGTGLVGKYLNEEGFLNTDGIDASAGMIKEAEEKRVYKDLVELFLGAPATFP